MNVAEVGGVNPAVCLGSAANVGFGPVSGFKGDAGVGSSGFFRTGAGIGSDFGAGFGSGCVEGVVVGAGVTAATGSLDLPHPPTTAAIAPPASTADQTRLMRIMEDTSRH